MIIRYQEANAQYRKQKAALTRAKNSKDPIKVLDTVRRTLGEWDDRDGPFGGSFPDAWSDWRIAAEDALRDIRRQLDEILY